VPKAVHVQMRQHIDWTVGGGGTCRMDPQRGAAADRLADGHREDHGPAAACLRSVRHRARTSDRSDCEPDRGTLLTRTRPPKQLDLGRVSTDDLLLAQKFKPALCTPGYGVFRFTVLNLTTPPEA